MNWNDLLCKFYDCFAQANIFDLCVYVILMRMIEHDFFLFLEIEMTIN